MRASLMTQINYKDEPVVYPPVKHKIPKLFQLIIAADNLIDLLKKLKVVNLDQFKSIKKDRQDFTRAAENFVIKQKGGKT